MIKNILRTFLAYKSIYTVRMWIISFGYLSEQDISAFVRWFQDDNWKFGSIGKAFDNFVTNELKNPSIIDEWLK